MSIFNSLGSNYSSRFVRKSLFGNSSSHDLEKMKGILAEYYGGDVTLTYKGRHALELGLRSANLPPGSKVGIGGFTCYVVYQAVERAGLVPVFIDVASEQLNFGLDELKKVHTVQPDLKLIIVQNTLGIPAPIEKLEPYCKEHNILIFEDLAHSLGTHYNDGREAGKVGDLAMLSFSQDKPSDVVAGGALVNRTQAGNSQSKLPVVSLWQRFINRMYPFWTYIIRTTYSFGLGRLVHTGLKKMRLLATPMSDNFKSPHTMSPKAASLLLMRWQDRENETAHRKQVANVYKTTLRSFMFNDDTRGGEIYLRFPIKVTEPLSLIKYLKKRGIYIGDTWYDAPIGPKRYLAETSYKAGECPNAEKLASCIVNLPMHINVSVRQAENLAKEIIAWQQSV